MEVLVLGTLEVRKGGGSVHLGGPKQRTVLALLAQAAGHRVSVDALIHGVYGDEAPSRARRTVQTYVSNLRHELGDAVLGTGNGYLLDLDPSSVDARRFEVAYRAAVSELEHEPGRAGDRLRDALATWRGHPYANIEAHGALDAEVARLQELRLAALEQRIEADLAVGRHHELLAEIESLSAEHPFRESLRAHLALAMYRAGRQADALAAVEHTRRSLADELGIDLSPRLQQLERRILMHDPGLEQRTGPQVERRAILVAELDAESWSADRRVAALAQRDETLAVVVERTDGATVIGLRGTAVFVAFTDVRTALATAVALGGLGVEPTFRLALDHGDVEVSGDAVTGPPVNRTARIVALAHPGQVLLSPDAHGALTAGAQAGWSVTALGRHAVGGVDEPLALYQLQSDGLPTTFPPLRTDRVAPSVPRTVSAAVPGYELREPISIGDLGTVYRAYQASVGREVVVRAIRREVAAAAGFIRRFEAEAQRVARLAHPHVLQLLDYWRDPDGAYLVHPLVAGGDLRRRSREGLTEGSALAVLDEVAAALAHAHERGVVHGRLHPGNVLLDDEDNLYVADLGLAQICDGFTTSSAHAYTAPETLGGGAATVAADVYAFGVLAFELLTGRTPPPDDPLPLPADTLGAVLHRATSPEPGDRYPEVGTFLAELRSATTGTTTTPQLTSARNPYKGLEPFLESDAHDFHGREELVQEMVATLRDHPMLAVVGPSGIGKSSVVRAGLLPALRGGAIEGSEGWLVADLSPGAHPFEELAAALRRVAVDTTPDIAYGLRASEDGLVRSARSMLPPGTTLLLLVDQFEELFTQTTNEDTRRRFLAVLAAAARDRTSRVRIVVTLRADLFDRPLRHASFAEVLRRGVVSVRAPNRDELTSIVRRPASDVGVTVEDRLVDRIVSDADGQAGALPMVQHVLSERFEARSSDQLTLASYAESGGIHGAVGRKAEALYLGLTAEQRSATRDLLLRLVTVDEDVEDTRRRVRLSELYQLGSDAADVETVLEVFGRERLVTFDRDPVTRGPTVEVAHEALLYEWERLRGWIDAVRDDLLTGRRLAASVREWEDTARDASSLLRGARLELAERWQRASGLPLTAVEETYLGASRHAVDAEVARRRRRRHRTVAALSAALVVTLAFSGFAVVQRGIAREQADLTRARELSGDALLAIGADPERAILLALEAVATHRDADQRPVPESVSALQTALQASRVRLHLPYGGGVVAVSPDGRLLATGSFDDRHRVQVVDAASGEEIAPIDGRSVVAGMAFSPDGASLAVAYGDNGNQAAIESFEVGTWQPLATYDGSPAETREGSTYDRVRFTDDGSHLAAVAYGEQGLVWDVATGSLTATFPGALGLDRVPGTAAFAVTLGEEEVHLIDARDGSTIETVPTPGIVGEAVALDDTGEQIAVNSFTGRSVEVWERDTGSRLATFGNVSPLQVAFAPDGRLVHTSNDGTIRLVHIGGAGEELVLRGHRDGVTSIALGPEGDVLASGSWAAETRTWDITPEGPTELGNVSVLDGDVWDLVPDPDEDRLVVTVSLPGGHQRIDVVDPATRDRATVIDGLGRHHHHNAVLAEDLTALAAVDEAFRGHVYDLATGGSRLELPPCWSPRALSPDGSRLVVDGRLLCTVVEGSPKVLDAPADATLRSAVIDTRTGEVLRDLGERPLNWAALGPVGTPAEDLAAVLVDWETIELHDLAADRLVGSLDLPDDLSTTIWFSDDGDHLAFATQSGLVAIIDVPSATTGTPLLEAVAWSFRDPAASVVSHTRIANGMLATGSMAGHVRLYDLDDERLLADLPVTPVGPVSVAFTPDATALLYEDGRTIRRLELDLDRLVTLARSRLTRDLTPEECDAYRIDRPSCTTPADA
jgi:serine/threonine protein kinase/DNA-binding SARP family transcriptional activator/WD40 repeat protein